MADSTPKPPVASTAVVDAPKSAATAPATPSHETSPVPLHATDLEGFVTDSSVTAGDEVRIHSVRNVIITRLTLDFTPVVDLQRCRLRLG